MKRRPVEAVMVTIEPGKGKDYWSIAILVGTGKQLPRIVAQWHQTGPVTDQIFSELGTVLESIMEQKLKETCGIQGSLKVVP